MREKIITIILGLLLCLSTDVWADNYLNDLVREVFKNEIVTFSLKKAEIIEPGQDAIDLPDVQKKIDLIKGKRQPALAITVEVVNHTKTKKINLEQEFQYQLADEFDNTYNQLSAPENYDRETFFPNKHFPSIYPDESFRETIFFEAPIKKSKQLFLTIDAAHLGVKEKIQLCLPRIKINAKAKVEAPVPQNRPPSDGDLAIIYPKSETSVMPGELVPLKIKFPADIDPPTRVYILSPDYLLEDESLSSSYDLRIPSSQKPGRFIIVVMATWGQGTDEIVLSKSINLKVVDPAEACMGACSRNRITTR